MFDHRTKVGLFMIAGHFVIILLILTMWGVGGFLFEEMVTAVGLIGPLFAGYTTVIVTHVIENRDPTSEKQEPLTAAYRLLSVAIPAVFMMALVAAVLFWSYRIGFKSFDQFKILVGLLEGAFGIYVGQFIYSMFKKREAPAP
jgi:hypothetical protein